ncbi:VOC family protein [Roseivirga sp. BDSF3-8]|uniref:VOC family protein n=1 Tax=Roseivirga sp. BDSF3-8 TaxID=3241598 RepID=UPI0035325FEB
MIKIEHIAIWCNDIERLRSFYEEYFAAACNETYQNPGKRLETCFLTFPGGGVRIELMQRPDVHTPTPDDRLLRMGYAHIAFSLGTRQRVNDLTARLKKAGYVHLDGPRTTGDGYYESTFLDPERNVIELTV